MCQQDHSTLYHAISASSNTVLVIPETNSTLSKENYSKKTFTYNKATRKRFLQTFNTKVVFYWDRLFLVGWVGLVFPCSNGEKPFSVGLVDQLFQPASNQVETVEKALVLLRRVIVARVRAIPRSYRVSTANGWKNVLLRNVNRINPNRLQLKRLIPGQ